MRAYKVKHKWIGTRFVGSEAEARTVRGEMFENAPKGVLKKEITIDMVEIPTTKSELIGWLNTNLGA